METNFKPEGMNGGKPGVTAEKTEIENQKSVYITSKKALIDLQQDPLSKEYRTHDMLVTLARSVTEAKEFLEKNGVNTDELDAEIAGSEKIS